MIGRAPRSGGHLAITPSRSRNVSASLLAAQVPKLPAAQLDSQAGGAQSPHRAPGHLELLCCRDLYSCDKFLDRAVTVREGRVVSLCSAPRLRLLVSQHFTAKL